MGKNIETTIKDFLGENKNPENKKAIDYFNSLPDVNKFSQIEDSVTDESIVKLANEISGDNKIVKNVQARVKTYDPSISWKAYDIINDTVEYYSLKMNHNIRGTRYIISKKIHEYDNEYIGGVSTLSTSISHMNSGWKDDDSDKVLIKRWEEYFKKFLSQN